MPASILLPDRLADAGVLHGYLPAGCGADDRMAQPRTIDLFLITSKMEFVVHRYL